MSIHCGRVDQLCLAAEHMQKYTGQVTFQIICFFSFNSAAMTVWYGNSGSINVNSRGICPVCEECQQCISFSDMKAQQSQAEAHISTSGH